MIRRLRQLSWYHATRTIAVILIAAALGFESNAANRSTYITAAIGLLAAEPVGRRERGQRDGKGSTDNDRTG